MDKPRTPDVANNSDYDFLMKQYVYTETITDPSQIDNSHMAMIKNLAKQSLDIERLNPKLSELSTRQSICVGEFGYALGLADTDTALLPRVLESQDRTLLIMPPFQHGYITGMFQNGIEKAVDKIHDAVTIREQKLDSFSWRSMGIKIKDVPEPSLEKLVRALLACNRHSRRAALEMCKRYYVGSNLSLPRYVRTMLLAIHADVFLTGQGIEFFYWKNLLIKWLNEHPDDTALISKSLEIALKYFPKHYAGGEWLSVLSVMLKQNKEGTWKSILRLILEQKNRIKMNSLLHGLGDVLSDGEALATIRRWVDADPKPRALVVASALPNNLDTMTKLVSLYSKKNKAEVALRLIDNVLTGSYGGAKEEHYRQKIGEVEAAKKGASDLVLDWLRGCEAILLLRLADVLWFQMSERFGIGKTESEKEKVDRDSLRDWLEKHMDIKNMQVFLNKFDNEKDGQRRQDGNVWHAELVKLLYEDDAFTVDEVECKKVEDGKTIDVDIKLTDKDNPDERVNIQAWDGMSRTGHGNRRMLRTGVAPDLSRFDWPDEHKDLRHKIDQLPKLGQNFVIQKTSSMSLAHVASHDLLTDSACVLQVRDTHINVYCLSSFKYKGTARKMAKMLRREPKFFEDDWASEPDGMSKMSTASYGLDPLEPHDD